MWGQRATWRLQNDFVWPYQATISGTWNSINPGNTFFWPVNYVIIIQMTTALDIIMLSVDKEMAITCARSITNVHQTAAQFVHAVLKNYLPTSWPRHWNVVCNANLLLWACRQHAMIDTMLVCPTGLADNKNNTRLPTSGSQKMWFVTVHKLVVFS